jgi:hypothetical protein
MSPDQPSPERPAVIEILRAETRGYPRPIPAASASRQTAPVISADDTRHIFKLFTGNRWLELGEREPDPQMLFGELWHQNELCILFADTNAGKSVLAVQIADSIASHRPIRPFSLTAKKSVVLYIDFELSCKQFHHRYSEAKGGYRFSGDFYRAQLNQQTDMPDDPKTYDRYIIAAITDRIRQINATVLMIDNITCMRGGTENAAVALRLMKNLKELKHDHHLSILVLAHTPKRNPAKPITSDDLQGSKLLINFADSAFSIGASKTQPGVSYLKQIKQRNTAQRYGAGNVCLCRIIKPANFLKFEFTGHGHERDHLYQPKRYNREELAQQIAQLLEQGHSQRQISKELNIPLTTVNRMVKVS